MDENPYRAPQSVSSAARKRSARWSVELLLVGVSVAGIFWYVNDWWAYRTDSGKPIAMFKFSVFEQAIFSSLVGALAAGLYAGMHAILSCVVRWGRRWLGGETRGGSDGREPV